MSKGSTLRIVALITCLALPACMVTGEDAPPQAAATPTPAPAPSTGPAPAPAAVTSPPPARWGGGGGTGARGGATTASARAEPVEEPVDPLLKARGDCWMKVEHQKLRAIDQRIAFVDKCVADQMKGKP